MYDVYLTCIDDDEQVLHVQRVFVAQWDQNTLCSKLAVAEGGDVNEGVDE
jgi:hypothetical protein